MLDALPEDEKEAASLAFWEEEAANRLGGGIPSGFITGLLSACEGRAGVAGRLIGMALMRGLPRRMACLKAGISRSSMDSWAKSDRELAELWRVCEDIGLSQTLEAELYSRAMAGPEDRGSARLLEIALKARMPEYNEKRTAMLDVVEKAAEAQASIAAGWQHRTLPDVEHDER